MTQWLVLTIVIVLICIVEWIREISTFKITHYNIDSDKLNQLKKEQKIVFLTDLHNNSYGKNNEKLIQAIRSQKPDLILIGGDMLIGKTGVSTQVAEDFIKNISEICPIYYANGNHEQRMKVYFEEYGLKYQEYKSRIQKMGVCFLENEQIDIHFDDCDVQITGLEVPKEGYKKFKKTYISIEQIEACIPKADTSKFQILLAHHPSYADTYLKWGADLVLCGHLHGGVVRIPGIGGVITPQYCLFPKYSGELTRLDDKFIVVSKGLGTHTIKMRFLNPAEVVVLHLRGK